MHHVRLVPGVEAVGLTDALPLGDNFGWRTWDAAATPVVQPDQRQFPLIRMIDEGYFAATKIGVRAGRGFTLADGPSSESIVIVNDTLARTFWPGQDPVGRTVWTSNGRVARRVIGVVDDVHYFGLERGTGAEMYMPLRQTGNYKVVDLVVMGTIPPASLVPGIRAALNRVDANLPTTDFRTMQQLVNESTFARRFVMLLIVGFAGFGLIVAFAENLCRDLLLGEPAHAGDRDQHGTWRFAGRAADPSSDPNIEARVDWSGRWRPGLVDSGSRNSGAPFWGWILGSRDGWLVGPA